MADIHQLPQLPEEAYRPEKDIPVRYPGRINRYVKGIEKAIVRLDLLRIFPGIC